MGLTNLFDIIYSDESIKDELNEMIDGIKLEKFMESHDDINGQFVLVVCKNIVYNKSYNKLKLEFHNINENNINNSLVSKTLEQLQSIINESLDLSHDNDEVYKIVENTINELDESSDGLVVLTNDESDEIEIPVNTDADALEDTDEDDDVEIPVEVEDNIKMILSKTECLQLNLFHRNYNDNTFKYITTFLLNKKLPLKDSLNVTHEKFGEFDEDEDLDIYVNLNNYYEKIYRDFNDLNNIYDYIEKYDVIDNYLIHNLNTVLSGFYFNYDDIRFQLLFKMLILTHIGNYGKFSKFTSHTNYIKDKSINNYFNYDTDHTLTIFDNLIIDNLKIWCDVCNDKIGLENDDMYYHNDSSGDLCDNCLASKKMRFYERIKYIKSRMLLLGRIEVFKKEVIKTRKLLKKRKYKIKKNNYYDLLQRMNKNLIENTSYSENECKICYTPLRDDIYVGSKCGHCFHRACIECCDKCQICREETEFIKLFL
jgi:hypothetical protein